MIEYEWARLSNGKFVAYVNDTVANRKMVTVGTSHNDIRQNFCVMLTRNGKASVASARRYLQANSANPLMLEVFGDLKRGGFLTSDFDIKTDKQFRIERLQKESQLQNEFNKFKAEKESEPQYDAYFTKTENGVIKVYGIKLVQEFKSRTNVVEDIKNEAVREITQTASC